MCELYAMSSADAKNISFSLCEFRRHGGDTGTHVDGWGLAFFDADSVDIYREPEPAAMSLKMDDVLQHHKPASMVMSHIRKATQGRICLENTQPYAMKLNNMDHVFIHNGNLINPQQNIPLNKYYPKGDTDSEVAFCYLMEKCAALWKKGMPTLAQRIKVIEKTFNFLAQFGQANFIYTDGDYLYAFANERTQSSTKIEPPGLHYLDRDKNVAVEKSKIAGLEMTNSHHEQVILASVPLTDERWCAFQRNQLIVVDSGKIVYSSH